MQLRSREADAERIGLKASDFVTHSLRAGLLTSAAARGASVFKMRDVSRHKSMDVLQASLSLPRMAWRNDGTVDGADRPS